MAKYSVFIQPSAQKEIERLPKPAQNKVVKALIALADNPRPPSCKKLVGTDSWRVRVGEYRIVYWIEDNVLSVEVVRVAHRKDVYR
ncbi:MAG: type II toxin-antitoxin system RelE family toxin [Bdellovibrio sp.]